MASFWGKIGGEISKIRNKAVGFIGGNFHRGYKLDSTKVDYEFARNLYRNTADDYKLGAGFAKPIINTQVSFMGIPTFKSQEEKAQEILTKFAESNQTEMQKTHLNALREGDCYVWITREESKNLSLYPERETLLVYNIIPPEQVQDVVIDPITGEPLEYVLKSSHDWKDDRGNRKQGTVTQRIGIELNESDTKYTGYRKIEIDGDTPPGIEAGKKTTPWDFIPIIHFKNDSDENEKYGRSEIEVIEPFLKAYHDVTLHAMQGSKMHSTPKLKLKLKDVTGFLKNNFGITDIPKFYKGGGKINLDGNEMVILSQDDEAEFIEANSSTGDAKDLLKLLFYCIVDASETPEFVFGVHTPASQASTKEQMPVLIRSVEKKRESFKKNWLHMARVVLAMTKTSENINLSSYEAFLSWDKIDPRTGEEIANEIKTTVEGIVMALNNDLISHEAAVSYLSGLVETMNDYETDDKDVVSEKDRIMKSKLDRERMSDSEFLEKQLENIKKRLDKQKEVA